MQPPLGKFHNAFTLDSFEDLPQLPVEISEKPFLNLSKRFEVTFIAFYAWQKLVELSVLFALQHFLVEFAVWEGDENVKLASLHVKFHSNFSRTAPCPLRFHPASEASKKYNPEIDDFRVNDAAFRAVVLCFFTVSI